MTEEPEGDDGLLGFEEAYAIASKIMEMADRLKVAHACAPGAVATWGIAIDDMRYQIAMKVEPPPAA